MRQFYENYKDTPKLSALTRDISWTNNIIILSRTKSIKEKEFYLNVCKNENFSKRELDRQISSSLFERTIIGNTKLSPLVREIYPYAENAFKDSYVFEFLNLSNNYTFRNIKLNFLTRNFFNKKYTNYSDNIK